MKKSMNITTAVLAVLVSIAIGCKGQVLSETLAGTATISAPQFPFHRGLSTYLNQTHTVIAYELDSRFILTVTKEKLRAAKTIHDIVPGDPKQKIVSYSSVSIRTVEGDRQTDIVATGNDAVLSPAQLKLLRSLDYSGSFMIDARYTEENVATGAIHRNHATPHVTIIPEKEARNSNGREAMIAHVRNGTSAFAYTVDANTLRPGKVYFTVNKEGMVSDVRLWGSSGYPAMDKQVIELVHTLPGTWEAATNAAGDKVEQEFVFSFGTVGC